ncbi:MAG TPA: LCP family protein, partial [Solirubrobacteraceae bacterium]|nr:LCP family protein [Solirubrobacteraceae bacterium]
MPRDPDDKPQYKRYRAVPRLPGQREDTLEESVTPRIPRRPRKPSEEPSKRDAPRARGGTAKNGATHTPWRERVTPKRIVLSLLGLILAWLLLSLVLFLISAHFERTSLPANVASVLDPAGYPLTSANNILVLGSDRRQKDSREPGAETTGFGRSDTIMLIRTGGGHAARLSIPRDTVVEIPGHGLQKINAAHEYGGPAESVSVIKHWLDIPINHVVEVNFENFPQLIDAMGGVTY